MKPVFAENLQVMHFDGNQSLSLELAPVSFNTRTVVQEKTSKTKVAVIPLINAVPVFYKTTRKQKKKQQQKTQKKHKKQTNNVTSLWFEPGTLR